MFVEECKNSASTHKCFQNSSFQSVFNRLPHFIVNQPRVFLVYYVKIKKGLYSLDSVCHW